MKNRILQKVSQYYGKFDAFPSKTPCSAVPDGPLFGNGDLGVVVGCDEHTLRFYLSKNDIWCAAIEQRGGGVKALGAIELHLNTVYNLEFYAEQHILHAEVDIILKYTNKWGWKRELKIHAYAPYHQNLVIIEASCEEGTPDVYVNFVPSPDVKSDFTHLSRANSIFISKSYEAPELAWDTCAYAGCKVLEKSTTSFAMKEGEEFTIAACVATNHDMPQHEQYVKETLEQIEREKLAEYWREHTEWWDSFWETSGVFLPDYPEIEEYWYASHYILACCCKKDKFAPGIFGNWITTDEAMWAGDYHLNYNYQAPWWGCFSSNKVSLSEPYDKPLLDYMKIAGKNAERELKCRGLYEQVGIGPMGLETYTRINQDGSINTRAAYWGQKSNAAYTALNMSMRFYSTYDREYAEKCAYPYLLETAAFWEDYLKFEDGRYVIYNDCIHENPASGYGGYDWIGENPPDYSDDFNPILTLGLLRILFKTLLDVSEYLGDDNERVPKWRHILEHLSGFPTQVRDGRKVFHYTEKGMDWAEGNSLGIQHIFPCGTIGLSSEPELLETAWNTVEVMGRWQDYNAFPTFYTAAARVGYSPDVILGHMQDELKTHAFDNYFIYYGGGGIECCSTVPGCINEMLLQSYDGVLRFFPVWSASHDAEFYQLRCYGAFLVSAKLRNGEVSPIELYSEKGRTCRMISPWKEGLTVSCDDKIIPYRAVQEGDFEIYEFDTEADAVYFIEKQC